MKSPFRVILICAISLVTSATCDAQVEALYIDPTGNVGIGTSKPAALLDVNGNIRSGGRIKDQTGFVMPVGTIVAYGGNTAPEGWLLCEGQNTTAYPDLAKVVGENVPDLRERFIVGAGGKYTRKQTGGEEMHTLTIDEMPSHSHRMISNINGNGNGEWNQNGRNNILTGDRSSEYIQMNKAGLKMIEATGGGKPHENRPPFYALTYIIKY